MFIYMIYTVCRKIRANANSIFNTDFSDFINSYDNFYYAYGIELLEQYSKFFKFKNKCSTENFLLDDFKDFYKHIKNNMSVIQRDFKETINFLYNLINIKLVRHNLNLLLL